MRAVKLTNWEDAPILIFVDHITSIEPDSDGGCMVATTGNDEHVKEPYDVVVKKVMEASNVQ